MIYLFEFFGILFQRPMIFGYNNAILGVFILIFCVIFSFLTKNNKKISKNNFYMYSICLIFVFINSLNNYFLGAGVGAFNDFIIGIVVVTSLFIVFLDFNKKANSIFIWLLGFIIFSTFITVISSGFNVNNYDKLILFNFEIKDRDEIDFASILIPFSTIPWRMTVGDIILPRATYLTIEPGVGVFIVILWRYLCRSLKGIKSILADFIMILGLLLTASTTMPIMILCWFVGRYFYENGLGIFLNGNAIKINFKKIILIIVFSSISLYLFFYMPYFGYFDKINTHSESFDVRGGLYSSENSIYRYIRILLLVVFYFFIKKYMCKSFSIIYSAIFIVSVLNVFAFTPLFFLSVFLAKKQDFKLI